MATPAQAAIVADVNRPATTDIAGEVWPEGDLPAQGGGFGPTLMPGIDTFLIPENLAQLWDEIDMKESNPRSPRYGQTCKYNRLKFDKNSPLIVVEGPNKGETFTLTIHGHQRPRGGKADDPATPWVSDLAYMLDIGLGDHSRPSSAQALKATINKYAGKTIRLEHGLSAHCRADKQRYILNAEDKSILDPTGQKGCGDDTKQREDKKGKQGRYYTRDFKDPTTGEYVEEIECECGAILRGFPNLERFVPPLGK
jgi:hypothetical protein